MGLFQNVISLVELIRTPTPELERQIGKVPPRPRVMRLEVNGERCTGCASCTEICPVDAIAVREGKAQLDQGACAVCGACLTVCPEEALGLLEE